MNASNNHSDSALALKLVALTSIFVHKSRSLPTSSIYPRDLPIEIIERMPVTGGSYNRVCGGIQLDEPYVGKLVDSSR